MNNNNSTTTTTHSTSAARPNFEDDSHFHPSSAPSSYSAHDFFMSKQPQLQMADGLSYSEHSVREYARTAPMSMSDHGGNISYNHSSGSGYHSMMSSRDFMNRELMGTSYDDSFSYGNNSHMMNNSGAGFTTSSSSNHGLRNNTNASMGREEPQHTRHARRLYFGGTVYYKPFLYYNLEYIIILTIK